MKLLAFFFCAFILQPSLGHVVAQSSSCLNGYVLCSSDQINVNYLPIEKMDTPLEMPCFPDVVGFNATTFFWAMSDDKELEFDLLPNDFKDDLDFILYKLDREDLDCSQWDAVRCISTGPNLVDESLWMPCAGLTGLSTTSLYSESFFGCTYDATNYLASIEAESGEIYALRVFNFTSYNGYTLRFKNNPIFAPAEDFPIQTSSLTPLDEELIGSENCVKRIGTGITSLEDIQDNPLVSIYPNPTNEQLSIATIKTVIDSYRLFNASGKIIAFNKTEGSSEFTISTAHLTTGVYLLEFTDISGLKYIKQFIKI